MNLDEIKAKAEKRIKYSESCDETSLAYTILKLIAALEKMQAQRDSWIKLAAKNDVSHSLISTKYAIGIKEIEEIIRGEVCVIQS